VAGPLVVVVGTAVALVAVVGLAAQAVHGNATVSAQRQASTVRAAQVDDAFYHCLDLQARSLVTPAQPVSLDASNLADLVTLLKGVGSWVTVADPPSRAVASLSLRQVDGPGACLGTVVVAHYTPARDGVAVRVGTGASVPGQGPPPAPPL